MDRAATSLALLLALSACSAGTSGIPAANPSIATAGANASTMAPRVMRGGSVDSVVGQSAAALLSRFGTARIDLSEGDARKLQFASQACVLDIYLYPINTSPEPVATHVEARERSVGSEFDRAACITEIEQSVRASG